MHTEAGSRATFDASKWLWEELYSMVFYKMVPKYAPFIMCFLNSVWEVRRPGEPLSSHENLTEHEVKQLRKKKHLAPRFPEGKPEDGFATSSDSDFELPIGAKPSCVSKLSDKLKKTFCHQAHVQKKLYKAHVNEKLPTRRQIRIMRALQIEASSSCEKTITPKDQWIYGHSTWTDDEVSGQPTASSDVVAHDEDDSADGDDEQPHRTRMGPHNNGYKPDI
ncbi:hypothetical protein D1007_05146 [Hordeum vulgare]|nr:hypothetical protein D1007_05146 [Hordeum vulgare]